MSKPRDLRDRKDPEVWPVPEKQDKKGLERYEYSMFSLSGVDGVLRYLFSKVGFQSRMFLEFGFAAGENNSLRLAVKEGFGGLFIDGTELNVSTFINNTALKLKLKNIKAILEFLDLGNLKQIVTENINSEIDLLSIDVDGNDYWFWKELDFLQPRVAVIEYNASFGNSRSITVPYDPCFKRHDKHQSGFYCGASLAALTKLGNSKGYALVGCDSTGFDAFFVRRDLLTEDIKEVTVEEGYKPHQSRLERGVTTEEQFKIIKNLPYIEV